jgi:hypothetical protein
MSDFSVSFKSMNTFLRGQILFDLQICDFLDIEAIIAEEEEEDYEEEEDTVGKSDAPVH